ncbi:MAG: ectoine/hydroxyectoine ABC transporter substrate-binding protein EhuB [Planctomycetota bacterium]
MESPRRIPWAGIAALALLVAALAFFVFKDGDSESSIPTLERLREAGVVRVGFANEAPFGYLDTRSGRVTGEAPEIARVLFEKLGIAEIDPVVTEFGSLIPGLQAGRFDVIAAGMYITPERCAQIAFTNPTYSIGESFLVRSGNPESLHSFEDVARSDTARLGVVGGTVEHDYARKTGVPEDRIIIQPDNAAGLDGLRTDRIDALAVTQLTARDLLEKIGGSEIEIAAPFEDPIIDGSSVRGFGAFGLRQEDRDLLNAINRELESLIGSEEHLELIESFGFSKDNLPGDVTADDLCRGR